MMWRWQKTPPSFHGFHRCLLGPNQKNHVAHRADPIFHAGDAHFFGDPMIQ